MINKIIDKLEHKAFEVQIKQGIKEPSTFDAMCEKFTLFDIKDIINEVITENHNGWIPCKIALPEETERSSNSYDPFTLVENGVYYYTGSDLVNVTVVDCNTGERFVNDDVTVNGKWVNFDGTDFEVIAWRPLPQIYEGD